MQNLSTAMFSSKTDLWETPQWLFDKLDAEFGFDIDVCALPENAKCAKFFSPVDDGLKQDWEDRVVWCNPPYGRQIGAWVKKAYDSANNGAIVVMLLPARTDTKWFHEYIYEQPDTQVWFLRGRLKFGTAQYNAPFPSMVVAFGYRKHLLIKGDVEEDA